MTLSSYWNNDRAADRISDNQHQLPNYYVRASGDRGDFGGSGWVSNGSGSSKSKKAEKKQAAMSALTLIAFLFFLNILQNCLKDQKQEASAASTILMLNANLAHGRDPDSDDHILQKQIDDSEDEKNTVKTRKLLAVEEEEQPRRRKFIHDFASASRDWTNELTQVSDRDIIDQHRKVDKLREFWNHRNRENDGNNEHTLKIEVPKIKVKKFVNNPILSDIRSIPKLSHYWEAQKTTTTAEPIKYVEFEEPAQKVADFNEFQPLKSTTPKLSDLENALLQKAATNLKYIVQPPLIDNQPIFKPDFLTHEAAALPQTVPSAAPYVMEPINALGVAEPIEHQDPDLDNTPRYRRGSEEQSTTSESPFENLFHPEDNQVTPTPTESTTKTFHVYTHPSQIHSGLWHTTPSYRRPTTSTTSTTTTEAVAPKFDINSIYLTTSRPPPARVFGKQRYPSNHRPIYSPPTRYEYTPNRRVSIEPSYLRHEYYPMSVVGQYGSNEDGPTAGVLQLLWSLITSFARPFVNFVPNASKLGRESPCIELVTCEAQRLGKYMGPTAQAFASTIGSIMRWVSPEAQRSAIDDAMESAQQNTCMKQIDTCDSRSGGKSVLTILAKMLEQKSDREPKRR